MSVLFYLWKIGMLILLFEADCTHKPVALRLNGFFRLISELGKLD